MNLRTSTVLALLASISAATIFAACSEPPRVIQPAEQAPATTATPSASTTKPAPPLPAGAEKMQLPASHPPIDAAPKPLTFTPPPGWVAEPTTMAMRREQYRLPKQGADTSDATVTVTVLAARDGGSVEPNLQRWASQFTQPDGSNSRAALKQSNSMLGGMDMIEVDLSGTYTVDERAMGGDKQYNEPNWRMLLSWIQSPTGNYYVKVVGPAATVAHWEPSFRTFVRSAAP
ncbi:MAG: hypothetical protein JNL28_16660 [Planctomycetes bacterium]|nr:hypothetical protein [Planctomycetota bacterium]